MKTLLTPKQVARAIGVSESSLKRWCDQGLIPTVKTPGGHRRLPIEGVLKFIRGRHYQLVRPEVLGLPSSTGQGPRVLSRASEEYFDALLAADEDRCRQIVFDLHLAEHRLSMICDRVIGPAFRRIGDFWAHGKAEVYQERFACEITRRVLYELRTALGTPDEAAPLAIGGAPDGDVYMLPTKMAELVLLESRWRAASLGSMLPLETLENALETRRPRLFWLSVSHIEDTSRFLERYASLYRTAVRNGTAIVVGGRALTESLRQQMQYSSYGDNLQHLESFTATLSETHRLGHPGPRQA